MELLISDAVFTGKVSFGLDKVDGRSLLVQALSSHLPNPLRHFLKLFGLIGRQTQEEQVSFPVEDAHRDWFNDIDLFECHHDVDFEIVAEIDRLVLFEAEPDRGLRLELLCKVALDQGIFARTTLSANINAYANQVQWCLDGLRLSSYGRLVAESIKRCKVMQFFFRQEGLYLGADTVNFINRLPACGLLISHIYFYFLLN